MRDIVPGKKKGSGNNGVDDNISEKAEEYNNFFANVGISTFEKTQEAMTNDNLTTLTTTTTVGNT